MKQKGAEVYFLSVKSRFFRFGVSYLLKIIGLQKPAIFSILCLSDEFPGNYIRVKSKRRLKNLHVRTGSCPADPVI